MPGLPTDGVRRQGDALARWHMIAAEAKAPRGMDPGASRTSLGDHEAKLERHEGSMLGGRRTPPTSTHDELTEGRAFARAGPLSAFGDPSRRSYADQ